MSCHRINLGSTIHTQHNHNLQLVISSSVQVSKTDDSISLLGENISLENLLRRDVWVSWSSNSTLQLNISVRIETSLTRNSSIPETLQHISEVLVRSPIWSGHGLLVVPKGEEIVLQNEKSILNIAFQVKPDADQVIGCGLNRFPKSLGAFLSGNSFIHPPPKIPAIQVRDVSVLLDFSRVSNSPSPAAIPESRLTHALYPDVALSDSDGWESLHDSSPFSSQQSISTCSSINSRSEQPTYENRPSSCLEYNQTWPYISLINAGLCALLSVPPPKHKPRNGKFSDEHQVSLTELSPSIFSPEYNLATHQRSCLIPLIIKGISSMLKSTDPKVYGSTISRIRENYGYNVLAAEAGSNISTSDMKDILRHLLWIQTQHSLYYSDEWRKSRRAFTFTAPEPALKKQEIHHRSSDKFSVTKSFDTLIDANGGPDPDWYSFDDEEEEDILLFDDAYCEQQEEWYDISTIQESAVDVDISQLQITSVKADSMLDSDGILSSSPCLLAEIDMDPRPDPGIREDFDMNIETGTELAMDILQSSSPLILPSPVHHLMPGAEGGHSDIDTDRSMMLFNIPNLDSSDIEMMLS